MFTSVPLSTLKIGTVLRSPIFDPTNSGTKLLGKELEIIPAFLRQLESRGIGSVVVDDRDLVTLNAYRPQGTAKEAPLGHDYIASLLDGLDGDPLSEDQLDDATDSTGTDNEKPFIEAVSQQRKDSYDRRLVVQMSSSHEKNLVALSRLFADIASDKDSSLTLRYNLPRHVGLHSNG